MDIHKVIRNLFAKAESTHSEHEAQVAILKAQELMAKHGISAVSSEEDVKYSTESCTHSGNRAFRRHLANALASNFKVKYYLSNMRVTFFGREEDVRIAREVFEYAYKYICRETRRICKERKEQHMSTDGIANTYALGFCAGLKEQLNSQSIALMVVTPPDVNEKYAELSKDFKTSRRRISYNRYANGVYEQGRRDGRSIMEHRKPPEKQSA